MVLPRKSTDTHFRRCTMLLTVGFRSETPWWLLLTKIMDLLIALAVCLFAGNASWQLAYMSLVLVCYMALLHTWKPYDCPVTVYCDSSSTIVKLVLLICVMPYQAELKDGAEILIVGIILHVTTFLLAAYALYIYVFYKAYMRGYANAPPFEGEVDALKQDMGGR